MMMKRDTMAKRSSFGSITRKRLSDITNSLPQSNNNSPIDLEKPLPVDDSSDKDYIDHLIKENMALVKIIQDKNKIIELSGVEIQKLRGSLQKLQLQNWNLAQSNSHMLAELNIGKEKLKSLQHESKCREALLKAKSMETKEQETTISCQSMLDGDAIMEESIADMDKKPSNGSKGGQRPVRSRSMGCSTTSQRVIEIETAENKRRCVRRKSATSKVQQRESSEDFLETEVTKLPSVKQSDIPTQLPSDECKEVKTENRSSGMNLRRSSLGRPLRKAAEKVQSYKEIPLNVKMRKPE